MFKTAAKIFKVDFAKSSIGLPIETDSNSNLHDQRYIHSNLNARSFIELKMTIFLVDTFAVETILLDLALAAWKSFDQSKSISWSSISKQFDRSIFQKNVSDLKKL